MYAVIETGGKQYRVEVGTELAVEHLEVEPGEAITLERVLLVADGAESSIGRPLVPDASVSAQVLRQDRGDKVVSFKYRPKARRRVKKGHRQELTILRVTDVRLGSKSAAESVREAEEAAKTERQRLEDAARRQAAEDAALAAKLAERTKKTDTADAGPAGRKAGAGAKADASAEAAPRRSRAKAAPAADEKKSAAAGGKSDAAGKAAASAKDAKGSESAAPKRSRTKKDE
jgi:large subunit ribosomal protein L21